MDPGNPAITAAVTPVVMISANAILVSAISSKHDAMSGRIRSLAAEWREPATPPERRAVIQKEISLFDRRLQWIYRSHILLYVAIGLFISTVISIALGQTFSLTLLLSGVALTFVAIVMEIADLFYAQRTITIETSGILPNMP